MLLLIACCCFQVIQAPPKIEPCDATLERLNRVWKGNIRWKMCLSCDGIKLSLHWNGGSRSSLDPYAPTILRPQVRFRTTTSTFFQFILEIWWKNDKKAKRGQDRPIFKNVLLKDNVYLCYPWWLLVWGRRPKILGIITSFVVLVLLLIVSPKPYFFHPAGSTE